MPIDYGVGANEGNSGSKTDNGPKTKNRKLLSDFESILLLLNQAILFGFFPLVIIVSSLFTIFVFKGNNILVGLVIIAIAITGYILYNTYKETPEKEEWLISVFKRYYITWLPGLHFLVRPIMKIDHKITINATKVFDIFMEEGSHKLEFTNGSAGLSIKVMVRALNSYKAAYEINITEEEIKAIELKEKDKGTTRLPERWMYFVAIKIEAVVRGVCGNLSIDDAIQAKAIDDSEGVEYEIDPEIIARAVRIATRSISDYDIEIEQITFSAVTLSPEIEKARDDIYIAEQDVLKQKQILEKQKIEADGAEVIADGIKRALWKSIEGMTDENGNTLKSKMSFADAMQFKVVMEAVKHIGDVTMISSGGGIDIPESIATQIGASFGVGFGATTKKNDKREKDQEDDEQ